MRRFLMIVLVLVGVLGVVRGASAASVSYVGRVVDDGGVGVDYAAVVVMRVGAGDSVVVGSAFTDAGGGFAVNIADSVAGDALVLEVSCFRYEKLIVHSATGVVGLPSTIVLAQSTINQDIEEVVVAGKKTSFTRQGDRYIFRISDELEIVKSSNVFDILKLTPLVQADDKGTISITGAGNTLVYINGRKNRMQSDALVSYLKSMPAALLSNIEVMPVANSTYAGEGVFGVVDIKLKKRPDDGVSGMAQVNIVQAHANSQRANISLNARKKKVGVNASIFGGNMNRLKYSEEQRFLFLESNNTANYQKYRYSSNIMGGATLGIDYDIDDKQTLGFVLEGSYSDIKMDENTSSRYGNTAYSTIDSMYNTSLNNRGSTYDMSANINYQLKTDDKGSLFSVDLDYVHYNSSSRQWTVFDRLSLDGQQDSTLPVLLQRLPQITRAVTGKAAYKHVFGRWGSLDVGADFQASTSQDDSYYATGEWENKNEALSNNFKYTEVIPSLFASYTTQWLPKFSTTLGGRMEYTYTRSEQLTTGDDTKRYKMRFLPTAFLNYAINEDNNLSYSLSNRIDYPGYQNLNSFRKYSSPTSYESGDPYLKPEKQLKQSLSYSYKGKLIVSTDYMIRQDRGMIITTPTNDNMGTKTMHSTLDMEHQANLVVGMSGSYFNGVWWANNNLVFVYVKMRGLFENQMYNAQVGAVSLYLDNTFILSKKHNFSMNVNCNFMATVFNQNVDSAPAGNVSMSLKKGFGDFYVTLGGYYLLDDAGVIREVTTQNGIRQNMDRKNNYPTFNCTLSYAFGDSSVRGARRRGTSGDGVKSRL